MERALLLVLASGLLCATATGGAADAALERVDAALAGLRQYYWNGTAGAWKCCGQNGGGGGAGRFGCGCDSADGRDCLSCYRWWGAQALQAHVQLATTAGAPGHFRPLVDELAGTLLHGSPYYADFGRTMSWVYVDDYLWYVLAFLSAFELSHEQRFLDTARETYDFLREFAWDKDCGGSYWIVNPLPSALPPTSEKNAVTNLEMIQAGARLHLLTGEKEYKEQALRHWDWFLASPFRDADGLLGDGLTADPAGELDCCNGTAFVPGKPVCRQSNRPRYTYNQGLFAGTAKLLFKITGKEHYLHEAELTMKAVLARMAETGVLHEGFQETPPAVQVLCSGNRDPAGGDFYSFKGVFALQLADFLQDTPLNKQLKQEFCKLVAESSDAAWGLRAAPPWPANPPDVCADPALDGLTAGPPKFPFYWTHLGPGQAPERLCRDSRTQISALSLFVAHFALFSGGVCSSGEGVEAVVI